MSKNNDAKQPIPDPLHTEAQLYQRIEAARMKIYGLINQIIKDTGLPTAIVLELLRGVIAETTLTLERTAHGATKVELEGLKKVEKEKAGSSDKS
jgi:hypothetical protein